MLDKLSREERLSLMKFVCSFAWADLRVQDEERSFVRKLVRKMKLDADEQKRVEGWLKVPPSADQIDPSEIPLKHRQLFLETVRELVAADNVLDPEENENLQLFEELLPKG